MYEYLYVFLMSVVPWIELRGSIPLGLLLGLDIIPVFMISLFGGIIVIPILFVALDHVFPILRKIKIIDRLYILWENKVRKRYKRYSNWQMFGLMIFVSIPLPGSGVYSGTFIAFLLGLERKKAFVVISLGALLAGIMVTLISLGALNVI